MHYIFELKGIRTVSWLKFKSNYRHWEKIIFFYIGIKHDHLYSLYTVSQWQFFEVKTNGLHFWAQKFHNVAIKYKRNKRNSENFKIFHIGIKYDHLYSLYTVSRWQFFETRTNGLHFWAQKYQNSAMIEIQK